MHTAARPGLYNPGVMPRAYAPGAGAAGAAVDLDADESAHLVRVLRLGVGAKVRVFDGAGREWVGVIRAAGRARVSVALEAAVDPAPEPRIAYALAVAVLKGDATDDVVRDAVMMGVRAIHPFVAARSETSLAALARGHRAARWRRVAVASAKQCGRAVVPPVHDPVDVGTILTGAPGPERVLLVEPGLGAAPLVMADVPPPAAATFAVGPEGGWTAEERTAALDAGWRPVRLGGRVLRAVTAPLAALAAAQAVWRDA